MSVLRGVGIATLPVKKRPRARVPAPSKRIVSTRSKTRRAFRSGAVLGLRAAADPEGLHLLVEVAPLQIEQPRRLSHVLGVEGAPGRDVPPPPSPHLVRDGALRGDANPPARRWPGFLRRDRL